MKIDKFLKKKGVEYAPFDPFRIKKIYQRVEKELKIPKIIHIIGTNGKGSTGRFLAYYLYKKGFSVGHFTSPHIFKVNERFWRNGRDIKDRELEKLHKKAQKLLTKKELKSISYFEYLTFLAILYFENEDFLILEAGLGGEFDSTSIFKNILTLITPIDFDHQEFLGDSIKKIATTKLRAIKKSVIIGYQPHQKIIKRVAKEIKREKSVEIKFIKNYISKNELKSLSRVIKKLNFPNFFTQNLALAVAGIKFLNIDIDLKLFKGFSFFGRFTKISKNIVVDVGHNPLASKELLKLYKNKKVILLYNTFFDKDFILSLKILKKIIKRVEIVEIKNPRIIKKRILKKRLKKLNIKYRDFKKIDKKEKYLLFGSFSVVEGFLKEYGKYER